MANQAFRLIGRGVASGADAPGEKLSLREVWRAVRRRKAVLLAPMVLIPLATFLWVSQETPTYTAEALLQVQAREPDVGGTGGRGEEVVADRATIESEVEFMSSPAFVRRTVEQLDLINDPEFAPWPGPEAPVPVTSLLERINPLRYVPEDWRSALLGRTVEADAAAAQLDPRIRQLNEVTREVASRLTVEQVRQSFVIALRFRSEDPIKAAGIANAMAKAYLASQVEAKRAEADRATRWLSERIDQLRGKVLEAEAKIAEHRARNNLTNGQSDDPLALRASQLSAQLALAQAQRAAAEALLSRARGMVGANGTEAAASVLESPLMERLRQQDTELGQRLSEIALAYGESHPQIVSMRAEIQSVRDKMADEARRIVRDLEDKVSVASAREQELQSGMARLQGEAAQADPGGVELGALESEVERNRELFQTFLARFPAIAERHGLHAADARVLSAADPPSTPSHPRILPFMLAAFAGSSVLGLLLVVLAERWDSGFGFRSADETQRALGVRALALVPDLRRRDTRGIAAEDYVLEKPESVYAEALQRLRTSLFLRDPDHPPKTILITSSLPLEGKSTIAASLARQSASSGLKVILIDADLRRPRLHELIAIANDNGLSEVLTGRADPDVAIRRDERSGLDFLPAGGGVISPPDLFRSATMRVLIEEAAAYYDLVIIDSPPVAAVTDSFTLSALVDTSIYVIRWERTPRNVALAGIRQMLDAGADLAGVVLSRVDLKKHARYGYADSGHHQGRSRKYYVN